VKSRSTPLPERSEAAKIAGWGLLFWGAVQLAGALLDRYATAMLAIQAVIAEWGAGTIGIAWSDPLAPAPSTDAVVRRAAGGALFGASAAVLVVLVALATRGASHAATPPAVETVVLGLLVSSLAAVRDELLLRGVVLRLARGRLPAWTGLLVCGAAAAAARFGVSGAVGLALAVEGLRGVALGALWMRDRGAWMACGANTAWMVTLGPIVHGGLVDVRFAVEPDAGLPALVVTAVVALAASLWALAGAQARLR
jgi:hypothetical protein